MDSLEYNLTVPGRYVLAGVPEGYDALVLAKLAPKAGRRATLHVARDDARLAAMAEALSFFAPEIPLIRLPAWDCLPYDRVSPNPEVAAARIDALWQLSARLNGEAGMDGPAIVLTTVNAALQRVPPPEVFAEARLELRQGATVDRDALTLFFARNGYERMETVREAGEFAVRGGIIDLFPAGAERPYRLDLFGDVLEGLRTFDPLTQRTVEARDSLVLRPVGEALLDEQSIGRFRAGYRSAFGAGQDDQLYTAISEGRRHAGMEHWLPLFHERLVRIFDYLPGAPVCLDPAIDEAAASRIELIGEYFDARMTMLDSRTRLRASDAPPYRPLPPDALYLTADEWAAGLADRAVGAFSPFAAPDIVESGPDIADFGARRAYDFAAKRRQARIDAPSEDEPNVFLVVREHLANQIAAGKRVLIAGFSLGARDRLAHLLRENGVERVVTADSWAAARALPADNVAVVVLPLEHGFAAPDLTVIGEQDILGERLARPRRKQRSAADVITDATQLASGDLVVHMEHGIGRYEGLEAVTVSGAPHDCLRLSYDGGDRLYVPVENLDILSRYGSGEAGAQLDRLGGAAWQARKARVKQRLKDMADELIKVAASRAVKPAARLAVDDPSYDSFAARFPYSETDDQQAAITATLADLETGRPMDRLVCGDVGFGKTEVALRAAFAAVHSGHQVAVVTPTTLLCRQHYATFAARFAETGARVAQLSRLVTAKEAREIKEGLARGTVDVVVGTHALLAKDVRFHDLGLLVIDEEQHFGVAHKERLKALREDVHVLTLTATPIPRTLQMALSGVREMSLIATPPVDRLAVRTFITPFDPVVVREALMREHFRGGQSFYVCPRIGDLDEQHAMLRELVPEIKIALAHGRMRPRELEEVMGRFYDGAADLLLSTQIVEAGLDLPSANTLIIHRADMFGLAQLYQLRGRVGRSRIRAYAYFTVPAGQPITAAATRRLEVLQSLDSLGAGFALASHDLDIRGAGNLLGEEQSGHIREVGAELYQHMLEEAVAAAREGGTTAESEFSPQINLGLPVLIPEDYVPDLGLRLELYRRLAGLGHQDEIEPFAAELIDRFGTPPGEVDTLLELVAIKQYCRAAGIKQLDGGPKGAVVSFHENSFANPAALVQFITDEGGRAKLRPDHSLVFRRDWDNASRRLKGAKALARDLAAIAVA